MAFAVVAAGLALAASFSNEILPLAHAQSQFFHLLPLGQTTAAKMIYRSMGPGNVSAIETGYTGPRTLTISGTTATFSAAISDNVGVGDAIIYDCSNNASLGAGDCVAFISQRASSQSFSLQNAAGATPTAFSANQNWAIYRAYTSVANAEAGIENSGISSLDASLGNFDNWSNGRDLVANGEIWNIAIYGDGVDTSTANISGWTTSTTNYLRIFAPSSSTEVGTSQRHAGFWSATAATLRTSGNGFPALSSGVGNVRVDGLQLEVNNPGGANFFTIDSVTPTSVSHLANNLMRMTGTCTNTSHGVYLGSSLSGATVYVYNNIIYDVCPAYSGSIAINTNGTSFTYNNTIYNTGVGIVGGWAGSTSKLVNNLVQGSTGNAYVDASQGWASGTDYNLSDDTSIPSGTNNRISATVVFLDSGARDLRLSNSDTQARGNGVNPADPNLPLTTDIQGLTRTNPWDIGAALPASFTAFTWTGATGNGLWNDPGNWSSNQVPGVNDVAKFRGGACTGGQCNATINVSIDIAGIDINSSYGGTISQGSGNTITLRSSGWSQAGGTFTGGSSNITFQSLYESGQFIMTGGTFTSTSGTLSLDAFTVNFSGGTFNHNNGTIDFTNGPDGNNTYINIGTTQLRNVIISKGNRFVSVTGAVNVTGNLTINTTQTSTGALPLGTWNVSGNVTALGTCTGTYDGGAAVIKLVGSTSQTLTGIAGCNLPSIEIASTGGTVTLAGTIVVSRDWTYTSGSVSAGTSTIEFYGGPGAGESKINSGTMSFANVRITKDGWPVTLLSNVTISGNLEYALTFAAQVLGSFSLNVAGNVTALAACNMTSEGGNATVTLNGTGAQTLSGTSSCHFGSITVNKTGGTLTLAGNIRVSRNWTRTAGTISAGTSTLVFMSDQATTVVPSTSTYNNVTFAKSGSASATLAAGNTMTIGGDLSIANTGTANFAGTGTLSVQGNVTLSGNNSGTVAVTFSGNNTSRTYTRTAGTLPTGLITVNKTGGTVTLMSHLIASAGQNLTISNGTLNMNGFNLTVPGTLTVAATGALLCNGGTLTTGTLTITGAGVVDCPGVGWSWTGNGADSNWNTTANWSGNAVPGSTRTAVFGSQCVGVKCNAAMNVNPNVRGVFLRNIYGGTITQGAAVNAVIGTAGWRQEGGTFVGSAGNLTNGGVFALSGGTYSAGGGTDSHTGSATVSGGTFNGNTATVSFDNGGTISGGTFNSTSGTLNIGGTSFSVTNPASFVAHASGTVALGTTTWATLVASVNGVTFTNLNIDRDCVSVDLGGTTSTATGTFTLGDGGASCNSGNNVFTNGTINVQGDVVMGNDGREGDAVVAFTGSNNQTLTGSSWGVIPSVTINKSGGTLTIINNMTVDYNFIYVGGTINWGTAYLNLLCDNWGTATIQPGNIDYPDVSIGSYYGGNGSSSLNLGGGTMKVKGRLYIGQQQSTWAVELNNGTVEAYSHVDIVHFGHNAGTGWIRLAGTNNQTVTSTAGGIVPSFAIAKTGGVATFVGTLSVSANFEQNSGSVDWITNNATLHMGGSFNTDNLKPGSATYQNVTFGAWQNHFDLVGGTLTVAGTLQLDGTGGEYDISNGTIEAYGNLITSNDGYAGNATLKVVGTGNQTFTGANPVTEVGRVPNLRIEKSGGVVTFTNLITASRDFTHISGTMDWVTNSARLSFGGAYRTGYFRANNQTYFDVNVVLYAGHLDLDGSTANVMGTFYHSETYGWDYEIRNGTVNVSGDYVAANYGHKGSAVVNIVGAGTQNVTAIAPDYPNMMSIVINKSSGTVNFSGWIGIAGSYSHLAGLANWGTATLAFQNPSSTFTAGNVNYNDVYYSSYYGPHSLNGSTAKILGSLTLGDTAMPFQEINNGTLEVQGNVTVINYGYAGSALVKLTGLGTQTFTGNGSDRPVPAVEINKSGGIVNFVGTICASSNYNHVTGSVDWGTATLEFCGGNDAIFTSGTVNYNHLTFRGSQANYDLNGSTVNVLGNLSLGDQYDTWYNLNNGTINVTGNVSIPSGRYGYNGTASIVMMGSQNSTLTNSSNRPIPSGTITVSKTNGFTVTSGSNMSFSTLNVTSGDYLMSNRNLTLTNLSLGGRTISKGGGILVVNGTTVGTGPLYGGTVNP